MGSNDYLQSPRPTRLQGDLIILGSTSPLVNPEEILPQPLPSTALPQETLGARYAFSQALARSTALSSIEVSLEDFLSSVSRLPHALHMTGKPDLPRKEIIQKLGHLLKFRQSINLNAENFADTPEVYWSEPALEGRYIHLGDASAAIRLLSVFADIEPQATSKQCPMHWKSNYGLKLSMQRLPMQLKSSPYLGIFLRRCVIHTVVITLCPFLP